MTSYMFKRFIPFAAYDQHSGRFIIGVLPEILLQPALHRGFLLIGELFERFPCLFLRPSSQEELCLTVQIVGRPVGCYIGAMAPDGTYLLTANALPDVLSVLDVVPAEQYLPCLIGDLGRYRWCLLINLISVVEQHGKRQNNHEC